MRLGGTSATVRLGMTTVDNNPCLEIEKLEAHQTFSMWILSADTPQSVMHAGATFIKGMICRKLNLRLTWLAFS